MLARTACRTRASGSCLEFCRHQGFHRWTNAVDDRTQIPRLVPRRLLKLFQGGQDSAASGVPQNHHQPRAEPCRGELHAADLRRCDDVSSHADDKEVAKTLIEDNLRRHPRVRASKNDGKRLLTCRQRVAAVSARDRVGALNASHETAVPFHEAFECFFG